ncbi:hypothetical protein [Desulfosudis oleivorans]|uniref:Conserved hypothetical cytosolic protein n=1 Tax=Desulfosudis oleivorans (strain DSM 6200 / JCM 39069 / Hxd3) TaxID=96561 RepID=A8ZTU4_DESOH|nr:hypothetical protein [Desulfosudis oleivorans]ABW67877.1 conserved hypothetical cytosolic protein [Desulfosudis oleivorans Hxd3]
MTEEWRRRCPRLGHEVLFSYCLGCGMNGEPCLKTADCWWEQFDVVAYLKAHFSQETVARLLNPQPQPKITGILELIEQAKRNAGKS